MTLENCSTSSKSEYRRNITLSESLSRHHEIYFVPSVGDGGSGPCIRFGADFSGYLGSNEHFEKKGSFCSALSSRTNNRETRERDNHFFVCSMVSCHLAP